MQAHTLVPLETISAECADANAIVMGTSQVTTATVMVMMTVNAKLMVAMWAMATMNAGDESRRHHPCASQSIEMDSKAHQQACSDLKHARVSSEILTSSAAS